MDASEDPTVNITAQCIQKALHNDFGAKAVLKSFQIKDFVKPGDGYIAKVTSVLCCYSFNEQECTVTYIAKLRASFPMAGFQDLSTEYCDKEAYWYTHVFPKLDVSLKMVGISPLKVPVCVLNNLDGMRSVFLMKDARELNFKAHNSQLGLDKDHVSITLRELAKFHAAGYIIKEEGQFLDRFPQLKEKWYAPNTSARDVMNKILSDTLKDLIDLLSGDAYYASVVTFAKAIMMDPCIVFDESLPNAPEKFKTICHGDVRDCNLMFRYSNSGTPEDVIFLDLQACRVASVAVDFNFFFFLSTDGELRAKHFDYLLNEYYQSLSAILHKASIEVPFTFEELKEEYRRLNKYGFVWSQFALVLFLKQYTNDPVDFTKVDDEGEDECKRLQTVNSMKAHPMFKSRYLSMINECIKSGVFNHLQD